MELGWIYPANASYYYIYSLLTARASPYCSRSFFLHKKNKTHHETIYS